MQNDKSENSFAASPLRIERDGFFRSLIHELARALEEVVGLQEASGFFSLVGQRIGVEINSEYRQIVAGNKLSPSQVAEALIDLKRRLGGDFFLLEQTDDKIVLGNRRCPFGDKVLGRPSICMMTSNVFGSVAANNLGFAKVELRETIAAGYPGCLVVVHLKPSEESDAAEGREYVRP